MYLSVEKMDSRKKPSAKKTSRKLVPVKTTAAQAREFKPGGAEPDAWLLLHLLNTKAMPTDKFEEHQTPEMIQESVTRIVGFISALHDAGKRIKEAFDRDNNGNFSTAAARSKILRVVNEFLQEYPHRRVVTIAVDPTEGVGDDGLYSLEIGHGMSLQRPIGEQVAVEQVIHLVSIKKFHLLRQCVVCDKWLLATKSDQVTCSVPCRRRAYQQTDEYKAKRREFMRKNYHQKKQTKKK